MRAASWDKVPVFKQYKHTGQLSMGLAERLMDLFEGLAVDGSHRLRIELINVVLFRRCTSSNQRNTVECFGLPCNNVNQYLARSPALLLRACLAFYGCRDHEKLFMDFG